MSSFQDLLNKYNSFTIHHQNIQSLATKIYKTLNDLPGGTFESQAAFTSQWRHSGVFIVNFEQISLIVLVFLLLTLNKQMPTEAAKVFCKIVYLENLQENAEKKICFGFSLIVI